MLTLTKLLDSQEYQDHITGKVALIHNVYYDTEDDYAAFIVVSDEIKYKHKDIKWPNVSRSEYNEMNVKITGAWTITRFFEVNNKLNVSIDHIDKTTMEVFEILLKQYSRGLA